MKDVHKSLRYFIRHENGLERKNLKYIFGQAKCVSQAKFLKCKKKKKMRIYVYIYIFTCHTIIYFFHLKYFYKSEGDLKKSEMGSEKSEKV